MASSSSLLHRSDLASDFDEKDFHLEKIKEGEKFQFIFRFVKLNENCFLMRPFFVISHNSLTHLRSWCLKHKQTQMRSFEFLMSKLFFYSPGKDDFFPLSPFYNPIKKISSRIHVIVNKAKIFLATNKPPSICR